MAAQQARIDKNAMKVCDICGGLQTASDTDKRMVMHVEGKLHTGYAKIRKVLSELKQKRDDFRRQSDRQGGRRSRSRSLSPSSKARGSKGGATNGSQALEKVDDGFNYSSKRLGTGSNCHETTQIRFSDYAVQMNVESNEQVVLQSIDKLGKEWGYYKRNIDKQRRELQNEQKRKEEEKNRQVRYDTDRSSYRSGGGGASDFRRPSSPQRGSGREFKTGSTVAPSGGDSYRRNDDRGGSSRYNSSSGGGGSIRDDRRRY